ncbi:MAG: T9SS type A sorting domain-containing protein, partial [bacterium]
RYDTLTNEWVQLVNDSLPSFGTSMRKKRVKAGADLVYNAYAFWALKGNKTWEFWRYGFRFALTPPAPERTAQASSGIRPAPGWQFTLAPNPMSGRGVLRYSVPTPALLSVRLYDAAGRVVRVAAESRPVAGSGVIDLDTRGLSAGVYLVRLDAGVGVPVTSLKLLVQ